MNNDYEKYEEEFRKLDKKEYKFLGDQLQLFYESMLECKFTIDQAFELVANHQKFIYDMGVEEFIQARTEKMVQEFGEDPDEDEEDEEEDLEG